MRIGILSMQRVINYGSYLQAYGLKKILEQLGFDVYFVDIKEGYQIVKTKNVNNNVSSIFQKSLLKRVQHVLFKKRRMRLFHNVYFPEIGIDNPVREEDCDIIVIGSDEVFNCCQPSSWGVSLQLFGDTKRPAISYAASAGYSSLERMDELGIKQSVTTALKNLKSISVRDSNTYEMIKAVGLDCQKNLDPVLIYDWNRTIGHFRRKLSNYILVYGYDNRINNELEIAAIKDFAKEKNLKLYSFGVYQRWCDRNVLCSPLELISYFDNADFIITDTFHGTAISIKRNKKFVSIVRDTNKNKVLDLLTVFGLKDRLVDSPDLISSIITEEIDYDRINTIIASETKKSIDYLNNNLNII